MMCSATGFGGFGGGACGGWSHAAAVNNSPTSTANVTRMVTSPSAHPRVLRRIVFVTGEAHAFQYAAFLRDTGIPVLEKPVTFQQLTTMVERMVGQGATDGRRRVI
jgi:hypothetical protein